MLIRDKEYLIVREVSNDDNSSQYVLKNSTEEGLFKVLVRKKESFNGNLIKFLTNQMKNKAFTDFVDYMTDYNNLYVFVKYNDCQNLEQKLKQEVCTLSERLSIAKSIIEKIIILDIPAYFAYSSLEMQNILVAKNMDIHFDYDMREIENAHLVKEGQCVVKLAKILQNLFKKELEDEIMPEMQTLIYNMQYGEISEVSKVFERFYRIYTNESPLSEESALKEKLIQKFKRFLGGLGFLMKFVILAIAIYYLFASINAYKTHEFNQNFTQIGTFDT
ncbi:MAG: hypothetical protein R3Y09_08915 [Clostridia bacterium]